MKEIRTMQRYKCDFCNKKGVKHNIAKHEKICYKNPDRYCEACDNDGYWHEMPGIKIDCPFCSAYDPEDPRYNPEKRTELEFDNL